MGIKLGVALPHARQGGRPGSVEPAGLQWAGCPLPQALGLKVKQVVV